MSVKKLTAFVGLTICIAMLTGIAFAMSSENFRIDWLNHLTGSGSPILSANYGAYTTIGQAVIGESDSTSYVGCLGYWCKSVIVYRIKLPVIINHFSP